MSFPTKERKYIHLHLTAYRIQQQHFSSLSSAVPLLFNLFYLSSIVFPITQFVHRNPHLIPPLPSALCLLRVACCPFPVFRRMCAALRSSESSPPPSAAARTTPHGDSAGGVMWGGDEDDDDDDEKKKKKKDEKKKMMMMKDSG